MYIMPSVCVLCTSKCLVESGREMALQNKLGPRSDLVTQKNSRITRCPNQVAIIRHLVGATYTGSGHLVLGLQKPHLLTPGNTTLNIFSSLKFGNFPPKFRYFPAKCQHANKLLKVIFLCPNHQKLLNTDVH